MDANDRPRGAARAGVLTLWPITKSGMSRDKSSVVFITVKETTFPEDIFSKNAEIIHYLQKADLIKSQALLYFL